MKKLNKNIILKSFIVLTVILAEIFYSSNIYAGNEQRSGQAGASELLINPWSDLQDGEPLTLQELGA